MIIALTVRRRIVLDASARVVAVRPSIDRLSSPGERQAKMRLPRGSKLILLLALLVPFEALASKPAVKEMNGRVFAGYVYEQVDGTSRQVGNSSVTLPESTLGEWGVGGVLTVPILSWLGGRVAVAGGNRSFELKSEPGFVGSTRNTSWVEAGLSLFVRDPELGYFDLGYVYDWEDGSGSLVGKKTVNELVVSAGFFIPDQGIGPFDWDADFSYGRAAIDSPALSDRADEFAVDATIGWYFTDSFRLSGGIQWLLSKPQLSFSTQELRGVGKLSWLVPFPARRNITLDLVGSGGKFERDLAAPFTSIDQPMYSVGFSMTFSYPGASSLLELTREYH
jgi:hypothetical protein